MNKTLASLVVIGIVAGLIIGIGVVTYLSAPPGANAATGLIIPLATGGLLLPAGLGLLASHRKGNRRGAAIWAHLCVGLLLLYTILFAFPAWQRTVQLRNYPAALEAFERAQAGGQSFATEQDRKAFFRERKSPDHDTAYLVRALWSLVGVAGVGFVLTALLRPGPPKEPAGPAPAERHG